MHSESQQQQTSERPERGELDPAALALLQRHGRQIMLTARRYAATQEDAEDAFQRAFEILLSKGPTACEAELVPWLKTVVKHEAFALRRQRERQAPITDDGRPVERAAPAGSAHDQAERQERIARSAEALGHLKPHELQALVLRAEGYSYREILERTGWSYTKLNRALTEGRRAFRRQLAGIEAGLECARLEPLLSRLADKEASAADLAELRPHLKTCLTCRGRLKEFRTTPDRVAALVPVGAAGVATQSDDGSSIRGFLESVLGAVQHKLGALGERAHAAAELVTGQKVAAVAASAAALAGGGTAVSELAGHPDAAPAPSVQAQQQASQSQPGSAPAVTAPTTTPTPSPASSTPPEPTPAPVPDPANEFDPTAASSNPTQPVRSTPRRRQPPASSSIDPNAGGGGSEGGNGSGEFTP
jgi:RNA polymerase sigma factor (sigma-70 family)